MMKQVSNTHEFIEAGYVLDLKKILHRYFSNVLQHHDQDDVINSFLLYAMEKGTVEKYDSSYGTQFSTFMFQCFRNYVLGYYCNKTKTKEYEAAALNIDQDRLEGKTLHDILVDDKTDDDLYFDANLQREEISVILLSKCKKKPKWDKYTIDFINLYHFYLDGYTDKEIADKYECSVQNIARKRSDMIKILKKRLNAPS